MSSYKDTINELSSYISARTPLVVLMTDERDRAEGAIKDAAEKLNVNVDFYTDTDGFYELRRGEKFTPTSDPWGYIEENLKKSTNRVYAIGDVRYLDGDNSFSRKAVGLVRLAFLRSSTIIVVTNETVWQTLGKLGMFLKLDMPSQKEREALIKDFISLHKVKTLSADKITQSAIVLTGYTAHQLNMVLNYAYKTEGGVTYDNLCRLAMQKDKLFGKNAAVTRVQAEEVHVAGLEGVKKWLVKKEKIFFAPREDLEKKHLQSPKGVLMVGMPGCGKSLSAKMIANTWNLPLYRFDIGALFDKYVGESEKNLRLSLDYVASVSPCILWIDEIEKELYNGGDNDTAKRILGGFLFWLQENSSRVFLIATANDVQKLPPELLRKGRFDEMFFVDLPGFNERKQAIELYAGLCLSFKPTAEEISALAEKTEEFSYADIEAAIKTVAEEEYIAGKSSDFARLAEVVETDKGTFAKNKDYMEGLRRWGKESAINASDEGR